MDGLLVLFPVLLQHSFGHGLDIQFKIALLQCLTQAGHLELIYLALLSQLSLGLIQPVILSLPYPAGCGYRGFLTLTPIRCGDATVADNRMQTLSDFH